MISIGLLRDLHLAEHEPLACREGRDHMDRRLAALLLIRPARGLAVDGDHAGRHPGDCGDPGDEAVLELLGIEGGKDVAEVIMRWCPITIGPKPAKKIELLVAEASDVNEGLRPSQHRQQTQQQHLVERIDDRSALARV
jgi:hypothetical protein